MRCCCRNPDCTTRRHVSKQTAEILALKAHIEALTKTVVALQTKLKESEPATPKWTGQKLPWDWSKTPDETVE